MSNTTYNNPSSASDPSSKGDGILNKASSRAHGAVDSIHNATDDAVKKAKPAIDRIAENAHQKVNSAADAASSTADWLSEKGEAMHATEKQLLDDAGKYITANPLKTVAFTLLAGFLLSRILFKE